MTTEQSELSTAPGAAPATEEPGIEEMVRANQANWDARTPVHVASAFYGLDGSRSAEDWFAPFEWTDLGELAGRDVLHLQCHLGTETAAFAERGARTVGLDFSAAAVGEARRLAEEAGRSVEFVRSDVHRAVEALGERRFDVIYTGKGALCYLPDLTAWAEIVSALLRPGGRSISSSSIRCSTPWARRRAPTASNYSSATTTWAAADRSGAIRRPRTPTVRRCRVPRRVTSGGTAWGR